MLILAFKILVLMTGFVTYEPLDLGESFLSSSFLTCRILRFSPRGV